MKASFGAVMALVSIKTILRGYLLFRVNGGYFLFYGTANNQCVKMMEIAKAVQKHPQVDSVTVLPILEGLTMIQGWHISKGWMDFFPTMDADAASPE